MSVSVRFSAGAISGARKSYTDPNYRVRIGMEAGEAFIVTMGSPETKQHKVIVGAVINLAVKIEGRAEPGGIYLGSAMERNLHTAWRATCKPVDLSGEWEYRDREGCPYGVYKVRLD